jgi:putative membrane protein
MRTIWKNGGTLAAAGMFVLFSGAALAQNNANGITPGSASSKTVSSADKKFAMEAAQGGLAEVELGHLAAQKGQNDKVKQFGQRMVDDHGKANDQLKTLAAKDNITLPTSINAKDQALKDKLSGLSGADFDKTYMQAMVKDHQKDINEFQKEANNGSNADLKAFAAQTLPTLQEHLRMAQEAQTTAMSSK